MSARNHAVVLGASMGGLLAARVLSEHYERVTLVERDRISTAGAEPRKGVPQGHHLHGLLSSGLAALEALLPALRETALARGAIVVDVGELGTWYVGGGAVAPVRTGLSGLLISRPELEQCVRELVLSRSNIHCLERASGRGLVGDTSAIRGLLIEESGGGTRELTADLIVDASGRGSKVHTWLRQMAQAEVREETVAADVSYTTCYIERRPHHLAGAHCWIMSPTAPGLRAGAALAVSRERYVVTLTGYCGERAGTTYAEMIEWARSLPQSGLYELLRDAEPCTPIMQMRDRASVRRRYEQLQRPPAGLLVFADALCSFNPSYGQGMSVAALEARALDRLLAAGARDLERSFYRAASRIIDNPWSIVVGGDLAFPGVRGTRTLGTRLSNAYFARVARAAHRDPKVARAFWTVLNLLAPPTSLFAPKTLLRVLAGGSDGAASTAPSCDAATPPKSNPDPTGHVQDARP